MLAAYNRAMGLALAAFMACLAVASGCQESPAAPDAIDRQFVLSPGETETIAEASVSIGFERVLSDNRCPADVQCIQAGDAVVEILVRGPEDEGHLQLHTTDAPRSARYGELTIALVDLRPRPVSTETIRAEDYRATIRVTR